MSGFVLEYTTKHNELVVIDGGYVKYWHDTGLPNYEGDIAGFKELYPSVVKEMLDQGVLKRNSLR